MVAVWQEDGTDAGKLDGRLIRINRDQRAGAQIIGVNECRLADHVQPHDRGGPPRVANGAQIA
ncbi:MAG: hypothetical protein E8A46_21940 [Bradyrhizobium sp.]|jgi:hypothetical protein|uniref:hypothetical protein n=1 Tax=Bradyrhizobium sp. TaxID=376 RepID=UPI00122B5B33|nr:hypothetical protein [Bradyrhizobium sp.]THD48457.1 MAG: hypothetical protein E8A46_21940 [Bradyrhizobium sp.]